ncbi:MAG TPA: hypothetical protein VEG30_17835 [Terriglobales bacterium]|nr:hypothetical protein [Terriglobales bacterium]
MRKLVLLLLLMVQVALAAWAQSPFDGSWKVDLSKSQPPKKPDVFVLQNGTYTCKTCVPPVSVKADGSDQPVTGHPYYDTLAIKVVDDHTVEQSMKKGGKPTVSEKDVISADGNTINADWTDSTPTSGGPVTGKTKMTRVAKGPSGAHLISGSWRTEQISDMGDNGLLITFKGTGDGLEMSTPTGASYSAKLDGKDVPYKGDLGITSVSLKAVSANSIEETDKREGKVISVTKISATPGGKTLTFDVDDKLHNTTSHWVAVKQ